MKVAALKKIIKEAVKEAILELKEEQTPVQENIPRQNWEQEIEKEVSTGNGTSLTLEQAIQQTKESLTPTQAKNFLGTGGTYINEDFSFTSRNAKGFIGSNSMNPTLSSNPASKLEQDMMKKTAAIVDQMKKTGKLGK